MTGEWMAAMKCGGETQREQDRQIGAVWVVKPCEVSGRIRRDNRASRNKNAPHHSSLLLFVNGCSASRVAFSVGAFGRSCHALAVFRYDRSTRRMITPPSTASFTMVRLVSGFVAGGVDLDVSIFRFQVPIELSAPNMAIDVIAVPINSLAIRFRISCNSPRG